MAGMHVHNEALTVRIEQTGNLVAIREALDTEPGRPHRQATELVVGVTFRVLSVFMGAGRRPPLVCFSHRPWSSASAVGRSSAVIQQA